MNCTIRRPFKVIRSFLGFGIEILENQDICIVRHFLVMEVITRYSYHTYFCVFQLPDIVDLEMGVLAVMVNAACHEFPSDLSTVFLCDCLIP